MDVLLLNPLIIEGPTQITCTNDGVYSVPDISCASYSWSVSPTLSIVSGQGTHSVTVGKGQYANSFAGSVSVTITGCAGTTSITKSDITVDYLSGTYHGNEYITHTLYTANATKEGQTTVIVSYPGATSYTWERTSGTASWGVLNTCDFILNSAHSSITLKVTAHTICGDAFRYISFYISPYSQSPQFYNIYPNPTKGEITIKLKGTNKLYKVAKKVENHSNLRIEIYSADDKLIKKIRPDSLQKTIDISNLASGLYIIKIISGTHIESHKIMLQY